MSATVGVGIDLVDVERFAGVLARRPALAARLFSEQERRDARNRPERLAARFAAKEATWKALGVGLGSTRILDVEVHRSDSGAPILQLHGAAARLAAERGVASWHLSLTHSALTAGAVVIAEMS